MTRSIALFAAIFIQIASVGGCHVAADDVPPADREATAPDSMQAKRITMQGDLDRDRIGEVARQVEGLGDIEVAQVKVEKKADGPALVVIEVVGRDLPSDEDLADEIRSFEGMSVASVDVQSVDEATVAGERMELDKTKSPEELKREIVERMRAQGVEGDIMVEVKDQDGEKRVEVRVEQKKEGPDAAPDHDPDHAPPTDSIEAD